MIEAPQFGLDHLAALLSDLGHSVERRAPHELLVVIPVVHVDSAVISYRVSVTGIGSRLIAAEDADGCKLPRFCPERHIVGSGQFCMYWERDQQFEVTDQGSAEHWLGVLTDFLRSQRRAANLRKWPTDQAWAHGPEAATAQRDAEKAGAALQGPWVDLVLGRRLEVERRADGSLSVSHREKFLYSAWLAPRRRTRHGARVVAACEATGRGRTICKKPSRTQLLFNLALALWAWKRAEAAFWRAVGSRICCGTMDNCGLKTKKGDV